MNAMYEIIFLRLQINGLFLHRILSQLIDLPRKNHSLPKKTSLFFRKRVFHPCPLHPPEHQQVMIGKIGESRHPAQPGLQACQQG